MVSNPYHPPAPGSDDPHHGVDLALLIPGTQAAAAGGPVAAALPGRVVGIITDRFPYGNAVLVETIGEPVESAWWLPAEIPTPAPVLSAATPLTCPAGPDWVFPDPARRSIYTLYAHLETAPLVQVGDSVTCGQQIGVVGSSGNAMNPHLHFETRIGPSGLHISSMAHYDPSASVDEMRAYCLWRISGVFQLIDPLRVLALQP